MKLAEKKKLFISCLISLMMLGTILSTSVLQANATEGKTLDVQVIGYDGVIRDMFTVRDKDIDVAEGSVTGELAQDYTAKQAICDLLDAKMSVVLNDTTYTYWYMTALAYTENEGQIIPNDPTNEDDIEGEWICLINGVEGTLDATVGYGDTVIYYFAANDAVTYADFKVKSLSANQNRAFTVQLVDANGVGVEGAALQTIGGTTLATTDANGEAKLTLSVPGVEVIQAYKLDADGTNLLTGNRLLVNVAKTVVPKKQKITVRIIGDAIHENGAAGHTKYQEWVPATTFVFEDNAQITAKDVLDLAAAKYGLTIHTAESYYGGYYISGVTAPESFGGHTLREYENGSSASGWMYEVNGISPYDSYDVCKVTNGDIITLFFQEDYNQEVYELSNGLYMRYKEAIDDMSYVKAVQTLTVKKNKYVVVDGRKPFALKVTSDANAKLTYTFSDKKVAKMNADGLVQVKNPGKTTITITAANFGYPTKSIKVKLTVKPAKIEVKALNGKKAKMVLKWKKDKALDGYQVLYSTNKNFKNAKKVNIKDALTNKLVISKLKSGKTYYVKIRGYKLVNGKKLYGAYSKRISCKVK